MWNADETQLNGITRFKVIYRQGHLLLLTVMEYIPHLTGTVSISGAGVS
jgi:hypothetical protein